MLLMTTLRCRRGKGEWSSRKIQGWNSRIPVLEVGSSTAGTRQFHCWNSRVPPAGTQFCGLLSITSWLVLIGIKTCPQWRDDLSSMTWRPVLDGMMTCSRWHDILFSMAWWPVLDDKTICSQCYLLSTRRQWHSYFLMQGLCICWRWGRGGDMVGPKWKAWPHCGRLSKRRISPSRIRRTWW